MRGLKHGLMRGLRRRSEVLLLLLSLGHSQYEGVDLPAEDMKWFTLQNETRILDHCFYVGNEYYPSLSDGCKSAPSLESCQSGCQSSPSCSFFSYWKNTSRCCFSGSAAYYRWAPGTDVVSGPKICSKVPSSCTEMPAEKFPGKTIEESEDAWPSHRVPQKLECWPKDWAAGHFKACHKLEVVEDSDNSTFPGRCTGLTQIPIVPQFESCESLCKKQPFCSMFQTLKEGGVYGPKSCWHGYITPGINCYVNREANFIPVRARRFVQGQIRVLANTSGVQIMGLYNVFDPYYFVNVSSLIHACKITCYSHLLCQYWQYYKLSGCWMEVPAKNGPVQYPPTSEAWHHRTIYHDTILAGEYIQHVCEAAKGTVVQPTVAPKPIKPTPFVGEVLFGTLTVTGIDYAQLSADDRVTLRTLYAENIADSLGVKNESVMDLAEDPRSVTLYPSDGLLVKFKVKTHENLTQADLLDQLATDGIHLRLKEVTIEALDLSTENASHVEVKTKRLEKEGLPWYCGLFLGLMICACIGAGVVGYITSQTDEDDMSHYDGSDIDHSPQRSGQGFSPLKKVMIQEEAPLYNGKGYGKGAPPEAAGLSLQPGGLGSGLGAGLGSGLGSAATGFGSAARDRAREVVARTQGAFHRAEERIEGMLPQQAGFGQGQAGYMQGGPIGPSRDQLMQYAHQGRPPV